MQHGTPTIWTMALIAEATGASITRVRYAIEVLGIKEVDRVGNTRVFHEQDAEQVQQKLREIERQAQEGGDL